MGIQQSTVLTTISRTAETPLIVPMSKWGRMRQEVLTHGPSAIHSLRRWAQTTSLAVALVTLCGCATLSFYGQAVRGQWSVGTSGRDIDALIAETSTDEALRGRLETARDILTFAESDLGLSAGKRFGKYVALNRRYVVWNVFAAPEFSIDAHYWCYPIVGCAVYRGYFDRADAEREALRMRARGFDVAIGGVAAYSTLGWFADPLLSTFIDRPDAELAALLFHELAHGRVFVPGDSEFNESYASFVEDEGVALWLAYANRGDELAAFETQRHADQRTSAFLQRWREALSDLYAIGGDTFALRIVKDEMFEAMKACYLANSAALDGGRRRRWARGHIGNADFVPLVTYDGLKDVFGVLFRNAGGDWLRFHREVAALGELNAEERSVEIDRLREQQPAHHADQGGTNQVECEALSYHVANGESTRTEHDDVGRGRDG